MGFFQILIFNFYTFYSIFGWKIQTPQTQIYYEIIIFFFSDKLILKLVALFFLVMLNMQCLEANVLMV